MSNARRRGLTLIETMVAMAVLLIGMLGLLATNVVSSQQNGAAAKQNRATALARDLIATVGRWDYGDERLADDNTDNNDDVLDSRGFLSAPDEADFEFDVDEVLLRSDSTPGTAEVIDPGALDFNEDGDSDYRRFVAVVPVVQGGNELGKRISAAVYWPEGGAWRRVVLHSMVYNPGPNSAVVPGL